MFIVAVYCIVIKNDIYCQLLLLCVIFVFTVIAFATVLF